MIDKELANLPFYRDVPLKVTFIHFLLFSNEQSEYVCSSSTLAKECGLTDNEVRRAIRILSSSGYISTENIGYRNTKFKVLASHWQAIGEPLASETKCDTAGYNSQPQAVGEPLASELQANADNKEDLPVEKKRKRNTEPPSYNIEFVDEPYKPCFSAWLEYKWRQHKDVYKTPVSLKTAYKKLLEYSQNNPVLAEKIIETAIANLWKGIFPLKTNDINTRQNGTNEQPSEATERMLAGVRAMQEKRKGNVPISQFFKDV